MNVRKILLDAADLIERHEPEYDFGSTDIPKGFYRRMEAANDKPWFSLWKPQEVADGLRVYADHYYPTDSYDGREKADWRECVWEPTTDRAKTTQ